MEGSVGIGADRAHTDTGRAQARIRISKASAGCAGAAVHHETTVSVRTIHRRARRGFQEEVTMLELVILAAGFAGGYAASVVSWPWIRAHAIGSAAEINGLRARAKALEDLIKGAL
jgi:hypothetical protein